MAAVNFPDPSASPWTNPDNGVTYEYASGVWRVVGGGSSLDDRYVKVAGDNMIGSLTIGPEGGPAVTTLSLAGGGSFSQDVTTQVAGSVARTGISKDGALGITRVDNNNDSALTVVAGGDLNVDVKASGAATFVGEIATNGKVKSDRSSATSDCFSAALSGDTNAIIRADGTLHIGGTVGSSPNIDLSPTGTATFRGDVSVAQAGASDFCELKQNGQANFTNVVKSTDYFHSEGSDPDSTAFYATQSGAGNVIISHGGKGTFAGGVIAGGDPTSGANVGFQGNWSGVMRACRGDGANLFEGYALGNSAATSQIKPDGSAEFAGNVTSTRLTVDAPGDTSRIQAIVSNATAATTGCLVVYNQDTTQSVVNITADGKVKAASFDLESLNPLQP